MGKGDFKTKRGKISRGSHGNSRPKNRTVRTATKVAGKAAKAAQA